MNIINEKNGVILIAVISVGVLSIFLMFDAIAQDMRYHNFSDTVAFVSIPNAFNVLSNIPFLIVGIAGLVALGRRGEASLNIVKSSKWSYFFLFLGSALVGIGSSYYHLWPSNETLVWDRIPMTIAFMGLYSIIISEFVSEKLGRLCLVPFLCLGLGSVLYWWFTESRGVGDLRYYAVVQFFPILTIPIILVFFKSKFNGVSGYWLLLMTYIAAKAFETWDSQIHSILGVVSGHSIKHVLPAIGLYLLLRAYRKRSTV
jgi:hypothetical protein